MNRMAAAFSRFPRGLSPAWTMALAALAVFGCLSVFSERIPVADGLGFDGWNYGTIAQDCDKILAGTRPLDKIYFNRFLPSAVCHVALRGLGLPRSHANIIRAFETGNLVLLVLTSLLWGGIAARTGLSRQAAWFGWIALALNHANLKYNIYYPVLTDVSALFLGMAGLYCFVRGWSWRLLGVTVAGAVTWPTLAVQGLLLFCFPARNAWRGKAPARGLVLAAGVCLALFLGFWTRNEQALLPPGTLRGLLPVSGLLCGLFLFWALGRLFDNVYYYSWRDFGRDVLRLRVLLPLLGLPLAAVFLAAHAGHWAGYWSRGVNYLYQAVRLGLKYPGEFLVAHTVYFGPWVLLAVLCFGRLARRAQEFGPGLVFLCAITALQALTPLSRQLTAAVPVFILLTALAVDGHPLLRWPGLAAWAALSVAASKFWLRFNRPPGDPAGNLDFAAYVSSTGCWMGYTDYVWQGLAVAALVVVLLALLRRWPIPGASPRC